VIDLEFADYEAYDALWHARPDFQPEAHTPEAVGSYREQLVAWLVGAGMAAQPLADREPVRVFVVLEDYTPSLARIVAIAESSLTAATRTAFDALGSSYFDAGGLSDEQPAWSAGALLALSWFYEVDRDEIERLASEHPAALHGIERSQLHDPSWTRSADLDGPIVACHTLRLGM
jgi:hypothetical protein